MNILDEVLMDVAKLNKLKAVFAGKTVLGRYYGIVSQSGNNKALLASELSYYDNLHFVYVDYYVFASIFEYDFDYEDVLKKYGGTIQSLELMESLCR